MKIFEKQGVWSLNEMPEPNEKTRLSVENFYHYVRKEIINILNKNQNSDKIVFDVPIDKLTLNNKTKLKPIRIIYEPGLYQSISPTMSTGMVMLKKHYNESDPISIKIQTDISNQNFKPYFFHETRHVIHMSVSDNADKISFSPIDIIRQRIADDLWKRVNLNGRSQKDIAEIQRRITNIVNNSPITKLYISIYHLTPLEMSAWTEQIFQSAYTIKISEPNLSKVEITNRIVYEYGFDDESIEEIFRTLQSDRNMLIYLLLMIVSNAPSIYPNKKFELFDKEIYKISEIKEIVKELELSLISNNRRDSEKSVIGLIENLINNNRLVIENIKESFKKSLTQSIDMFKKIIDRCVKLAYNEIYNIDVEKRAIKKQFLMNSVSLDSNLNLYTEAVITSKNSDNQQKYIAMIKGNTFDELYARILYLAIYLNKDYIVGFMFVNIQNSFKFQLIDNFASKEEISFDELEEKIKEMQSMSLSEIYKHILVTTNS